MKYFFAITIMLVFVTSCKKKSTEVDPLITSFSPTSVVVGNTVTIKGLRLGGTTEVKIGGTPVTSFKVLSDSVVTAVVGKGGTDTLSVTTPFGTAIKAGFNLLSITPETVVVAQPSFDNSNFGIYKGVIGGTGSGTIKLEIYNHSNVAKAYLVLDNVVRDTLITSTPLLQFDQISADFSGRIASFNLYIGSTGLNPSISNLVINGFSDMKAQIIKELSNQQVKCYEGLYVGTDNGIFNLASRDTLVLGLVKSDGKLLQVPTSTGKATANNNGFSGSLSNNTFFSGTFSTNYVQGKFNNSSSFFDLSGTFKGIRTL